MRLWSLHPRYLDPQGLVALWREALLAQAVLRRRTLGYRNHPQLDRFKALPNPVSAIARYLAAVCDEAAARGYRFDRKKIAPRRSRATLSVTDGQLRHEWRHLMKKLAARNPALHRQWRGTRAPAAHPMFRATRGGVAPWERV